MYPVMSETGRRAWVEETHRRVSGHWPAVATREAKTVDRTRHAWLHRPRVARTPAPIRS